MNEKEACPILRTCSTATTTSEDQRKPAKVQQQEESVKCPVCLGPIQVGPNEEAALAINRHVDECLNSGEIARCKRLSDSEGGRKLAAKKLKKSGDITKFLLKKK